VAFNLFSAPCFAAIATIKKELESLKHTFFVVCFQIGIAWVVSAFIFVLMRFFGV
jgi:ferrous iron transport protein B